MANFSGFSMLVLEDDYLQGDRTRKAIRAEFAGCNVDHLTSESEFYGQISELASKPPQIIVMDIKLPWEEMSENRKTPPVAVIKEGDRRAGLRCWKRIAGLPEFSKTQGLFYSHILDDDLEKEIRALPLQSHFLSKSHSPAIGQSSLAPLLKKLRELLGES